MFGRIRIYTVVYQILSQGRRYHEFFIPAKSRRDARKKFDKGTVDDTTHIVSIDPVKGL